ncbi:MAG: hypothetical protein PHU34_08020 [Candidatus Methanoperedens sp.]|nr:hypothetical protein [Candidatus Methanoperedens sp.]
MNGLYEMRGLPGFFRKNEPQINADERRFANRVSSFIRALKSVFAPSAYFAVRAKHAPQRARRTQRREQ